MKIQEWGQDQNKCSTSSEQFDKKNNPHQCHFYISAETFWRDKNELF